MSHVAIVKTQFTDLDLLEMAAANLGFKLVRNAGSFRAFNYRKECHHKLVLTRIPGEEERAVLIDRYNRDYYRDSEDTPKARQMEKRVAWWRDERSWENPYEIGVTVNDDGTLTLLADDYGGGSFGIQCHGGGTGPAAGVANCRLNQEYSKVLATREAEANGYVVSSCEYDEETGNILLQAVQL